MAGEVCQFCGIEIQFRYIRGSLVPLHPKGSGCLGKQLYLERERDVCHLTKCPKCSSDVYFIRHNGGCAWFDDLGKPWEKHPCFSDTAKCPDGWEERLHSGWSVRFLVGLGPLVDGTGGVFVVCRKKPNRRTSFRNVIQTKLLRDGCDRDEIARLDGKAVLMSGDERHIFAPDAVIWKLMEHVPSYRSWSHSIDRDP